MTVEELIVFRINKLSEERGISINKLSEISGIRQSTLQNIMSGKTKNPELKTLTKIARGLGMTVSEFLDFEELNSLYKL